MGGERVVTSGVFQLDDRFLNIDTDVWIIAAIGDIAQQGRVLAAGGDHRTGERPTSSKEGSRLICGKSRP
jgi:hypothetical protein